MVTEAVVRRYSMKIGVLKNLAKFTGKHRCQILFFHKVAGPNLLKKRLWHRCFPVNFAKFLRTPFYRTPSNDRFCHYKYMFGYYGKLCVF